MTGLLSDHLFSEALECPIRFGLTQAAAKAKASEMPLKWQTRRVLRKIFCRSLPVPDLTAALSSSPGELSHWARSQAPGVICDLHVRHDPYITRVPILYRLPGQPLRIAQLQGKRWNPARDRLTDRNLRHPLYRRYFFQLAYRRWVFEKAFGICGIDLGIVFPASTFRAPVHGLFDQATGRGAETVADGMDSTSGGLDSLDGAFTWVEATSWVDSILRSRFDPVRPLVPPSAEAFSSLTDWDAWIEGLAEGIGSGVAAAGSFATTVASEPAAAGLSSPSAAPDLAASGRNAASPSSTSSGPAAAGLSSPSAAPDLAASGPVAPSASSTSSAPAAAAEERPAVPHALSADVFRPSRSCIHCRYRRTGPDPGPGCWERHLGQGLQRPDLHVPDLPGHGNDVLIQRGAFFMESLTHADVPEADDEPQSFSLQWRRSVLVEFAKLGSPRAETLHPTLRDNLSKLVYPLHFIDFEACTFPVPLNLGGRMHDTLVFQYSCHTVQRPGPLGEAGIRHHHWIDSEFSSDPERRFAESLASIPEIESGTLVHFAPFEPQHLSTVARRLANGGSAGNGSNGGNDSHDGNGSNGGNDSHCGNGLLEAALAGPSAKGRFLDVAAWLREGYHHPELQGGLGLKDLARALATVPHLRQEWKALSASQTGLGQQDMQDLILGGESEGFTEGEEAMHAYLLMRAGEVPADRIPRWTDDLVRYCALDTMAMVLAVRHWQWLCERMPRNANDPS